MKCSDSDEELSSRSIKRWKMCGVDLEEVHPPIDESIVRRRC